MGKSKSLRNLFRRRRPTSTSPSVPHPRTTVEDLERVFAKFDTNGDGKISLSELASVFESLSGTPPSEEDLKAAMDEADADKDGFISLPEFVDLNTCGVEPEEALEDIREAFAVFDLDRDGWISAEELEEVLGSLGEGATAAQCRRMIGGVDRDGDGRISFEEFRAMMAAGSSFASSSEVSIRKVKG